MTRDSQEFIELLTSAQRPVFGYLVSLTGGDHASAQDLLQETNVTIWEKAADFESGTNFNAWACRIAYFRVLNHRRKKSREKLVFDDDVLDYLAERQEERVIELQDESERRLVALRECVATLPEKQQEAIHGRYETGSSVQELADETGRSVGAVTQLLFRIRGNLHRCIEQKLARKTFQPT